MTYLGHVFHLGIPPLILLLGARIEIATLSDRVGGRAPCLGWRGKALGHREFAGQVGAPLVVNEVSVALLILVCRLAKVDHRLASFREWGSDRDVVVVSRLGARRALGMRLLLT